MTDTYGPFEGLPWSEADWYDFANTWAKSGVIGSPASAATSGELAFASSGLNVSAAAGRAWVRGAGFKRVGSAPTHAVTANAHASFSRRDRLVLRRDLANNQVVTAVLQGTPASSPTAPALTQVEAGVWEEALFSFLTPPSSGTTITGVIDERRWIDPSRSGECTLGDDYLALQTTINSATWIDLATVTATSTGGVCVARISETAFNGNSGADRTMDVRVICDGVQIGSFGGILMPIANLQPISRFAVWSSTPAAGSHTWKLQVQASTTSAVVVQSAMLTVVEK